MNPQIIASMENNNSSVKKWTLQKIVETFPVWLLGISTVSIIFGVLIVNIYLAKFGISSNELLRTEHILAGAVFGVLILSFHITFRYVVKYGRKAINKWKERRFVKAIIELVEILVLFSVPTLFTIFIVIGGGEFVHMRTIAKTIGGVYLAWLMSFSMVAQLRKLISFVEEDTSTAASNVDVHELLMASIGLVMALSIYAYMSYPNISSTFGGGNRAQAILYLNANGIEVCKKLMLPMQNERIIGPIDVLIETDYSISVLANDALSGRKVALQLNRNLIDVVQTKTELKFGN